MDLCDDPRSENPDNTGTGFSNVRMKSTRKMQHFPRQTFYKELRFRQKYKSKVLLREVLPPASEHPVAHNIVIGAKLPRPPHTHTTNVAPSQAAKYYILGANIFPGNTEIFPQEIQILNLSRKYFPGHRSSHFRCEITVCFAKKGRAVFFTFKPFMLGPPRKICLARNCQLNEPE